MIKTEQEIIQLFEQTKTIAVVGASPKPWRDSGSIAQYLERKGFTVYPVNPRYQEVLGMKCYPDLKSIPGSIDMVNIFRNSDEVGPVIDEAIQVKARSVWMQLNVINEEAAQKAETAGLKVVMDRCIAVDHRALM